MFCDFFDEGYKESINLMIKDIISTYPELRYGQIISIAARYGGWEGNNWGSKDIFYCPDEIIYKGLQRLIGSGKLSKLSNLARKLIDYNKPLRNIASVDYIKENNK